MNMLASLLAMVAFGADAPPGTAGAMTYHVWFVEMRGLDWRGEVQDRLTPVVSREGKTVWTAPFEMLSVFREKADRTILTHSFRMQPETEAWFSQTTGQAYVADLSQVANGPYQPRIGRVTEWLTVQLKGRWVDQGAWTQVGILERRLAGLDSSTIPDPARDAPKAGTRAAALDTVGQAPEVVANQVAGEWLIPEDGLLVVSLGAYARPVANDQPEITERLAIIEPVPAIEVDAARSTVGHVGSGPFQFPAMATHPMMAGASQVAAGLPKAVGAPVACYVEPPATVRVAASAPTTAPPTEAADAPAQPMPVPPSRVLPTPINHKGEVVSLPPLPEDSEPIVAEEESAEPRPAPQSRLRDRPKVEPVPVSEPTPISEPTPEAKAPNRELTENASQPPRVLAGQIHVGIGFGPRGLAVSGQIRLARGAVDSPRAANALEALVKSWTDEAKKRLTTSIGIQGPGGDRTLCQEIAAGIERFARSGEAADGPVCIFELKSQDPNGQTGHVAVIIEADEVGRKLLTKVIPTGSLVRVPVFGRGQDFQINLSPGTVINRAMVNFRDPNLFNKRDTETHQASTSPTAKQERKDCPQAAGKAPKKAGDTPEPECPEVVEPQARAPETWGLSLPDAIRVGLENGRVLKVVALGAGVVPAPMVLSGPAEAAPAEIRARAEAVVKTIEQAYWGLVQAQKQHWAAQTAFEMAEHTVRRERLKITIGHGSIPETREAEQQLERFRHDRDQRIGDLLAAQRKLRQALGLPENDGRQLAASSEPETEQAHYDWGSCVAQLVANHPEAAEYRATIQEAAYRLASGQFPTDLRAVPQDLIREGELCRQVLQQATHQLARFYREVQASYKLYQDAQRLKQAALERLVKQKDSYEQGAVTVDHYLDAVSRWANAIALEAEFLTRYNASIADLEAAKGTLLVRDGIALLEMEEPARVVDAITDEGLTRTVFEPEEAPMNRVQFGLSPAPVCPVFQAEPLLIRMPVGRFGVIELRRADSPHVLGPYW